jgi:hypothetical protein
VNHLVTTPKELHAGFLDWADAISAWHRPPRWYNRLCAICMTTFYRLALSRCRCDWRILVNARLHRAIYATGRQDHTLAFRQERRAAYVNDVAIAAPPTSSGTISVVS